MPPRLSHYKSSARDLRMIFEQSFRAWHIAEFNLKTCRQNEQAAVVRRRMEEQKIDCFPVKAGNKAVGFVLRNELNGGSCERQCHPFRPEGKIDAESPLSEVVKRLLTQERLFVTRQDRVKGIITRGDLQRAPTRMLLFGLLTTLEMQMRHLVRTECGGDSCVQALAPMRVTKAERMFARLEGRNEEIDKLECVELCDVWDLILRQPRLARRLGVAQGSRGNALRQESMAIRNTVVHGRDLKGRGTWPDRIQQIQNLEAFLVACETNSELPSSGNG